MLEKVSIEALVNHHAAGTNRRPKGRQQPAVQVAKYQHQVEMLRRRTPGLQIRIQEQQRDAFIPRAPRGNAQALQTRVYPYRTATVLRCKDRVGSGTAGHVEDERIPYHQRLMLDQEFVRLCRGPMGARAIFLIPAYDIRIHEMYPSESNSRLPRRTTVAHRYAAAPLEPMKSPVGLGARGALRQFFRATAAVLLAASAAAVPAQRTADEVANRALLMAAEAGRADLVGYALDNGADPNTRDLPRGGLSPLMLAAANGHMRASILLLDAGADIDARSSENWTALMFAARFDHRSIVGALLDRGADPNLAESARGNTALLEAASRAHEHTVRRLIQGGADPNKKAADGYTPLMGAARARTGLTTAVELIGAGARVDDHSDDGRRALHAAAEAGNARTVELLLLNGADANRPDKSGRTPLLLASSGGHLETVALLLSTGADPDRRAEDGASPLGKAVLTTRVAVAGRLVAAGADVDLPGESGRTPLIDAVRTGHTPMVDMLLAAGADPNMADAVKGRTPLMYAANHGFADLVDLLLDRGADPRAQAADGWTALEAAEMVGESGIMAALKAAGATR